MSGRKDWKVRHTLGVMTPEEYEHERQYAYDVVMSGIEYWQGTILDTPCWLSSRYQRIGLHSGRNIRIRRLVWETHRKVELVGRWEWNPLCGIEVCVNPDHMQVQRTGTKGREVQRLIGYPNLIKAQEVMKTTGLLARHQQRIVANQVKMAVQKSVRLIGTPIPEVITTEWVRSLPKITTSFTIPDSEVKELRIVFRNQGTTRHYYTETLGRVGNAKEMTIEEARALVLKFGGTLIKKEE